MDYKKIPVTQPSLPPLEEFLPYLQKIWDSKVLTNNGPFHMEFESALCQYLDVPHASLFSNATIALIAAIKALDIKGEVITTPYSFVATAHSLIWNNLTPVFVDIDPLTLNIDPIKIEAAITSRTSAIMPVHVYGNPCDTDAIQSIAKKYSLKVIYDAAHAFGVKCHCDSLLNHGDLSILSFHATKVFNTFEGGAIICKDIKLKKKIDQIKNFGFTGELTVESIGINGKMSEFSSALGLLQLKYVNEEIDRRKKIDAQYRDGLKDEVGIYCHVNQEGSANYSYFPIFVNKAYPLTRDQLYEKLKKNGVNGRRYFYPLITDFQAYVDRKDFFVAADLKNANLAADQVLCLPIYSSLTNDEVNKIIRLIKFK